MRKFFVWAILCCLSLPALAGVKIETWSTPSGARVFFVPIPGLPILDMQIDFAAGRAYDPPAKSGVANFTARLLDGGAGMLDENAIADRVADYALQPGASADPDRFSFSMRSLSSERERGEAVELTALLLAAPTFPATVMERERQRVIDQLREQETKPDAIAAKRFAAAIYGDHPYGWHATPESIAAITRDDLVRFHHDFLVAARATITLVGNIDRPTAEAIAERLMRDLPPQGSTAGVPPVPPVAPQNLRITHPAQQAHVRLGEPVLKRGDADFFPLHVGNYVLGGGGFVSRLMQEVREKRGYAYSVGSYFQPLAQEGPFQAGLQTRRDQAVAALDLVRATIDQFVDQGPTEAELRDAKRNLIDGYALRLDSNRKLLDQVAVIGFYGLPLDYLDRYPARVEAVTAAQVRDAFRRRIKLDGMSSVMVGVD
ncbi:MAG: insulinase family protein [Rhodocyclaceae bacterium]|nr:insulinase family protein [Rhodocyclaceae bacterium]MBX3671086.1 insulinase family protein [Rhodocyclaceae bacterium]